MTKDELVAFIKAARETATDNVALAGKELYPEWQADISVAEGDRYRYGDNLYKCIQAHTTQAEWTPDATPAMWTVIDVQHAGTKEDPIPWAMNMECYEGKYYTWENVLYRCIRDSGQALAYTPNQLLGNYFELA